MEKKSYKSWTISDEFWEKVKSAVPDTGTKREPNKTYQHKPGQGRKPIPPRKILAGILYVLRTGCQWKAAPKEYASGSSLHRYFQAWTKAGFFLKIWRVKRLDQIRRTEAKWERNGASGQIRAESLWQLFSTARTDMTAFFWRLPSTVS